MNVTNGLSTFAYGLTLLDEIAFDHEGRLLAVEELDNSVTDASAGGDLSGVTPLVTNLGQFPQQIAAAPVPLPAAFWLFFSGLIALLPRFARRAGK